MTIKKQDNSINTSGNHEVDVVVEYKELDEIFHFSDEENCYKDQWIDEESKVAYKRQKTAEEIRVDLWRAKVVDPKTSKFYTSGEGTGRCLGKQGPRRFVNSIVRFKAKNGEFLLSHGYLIGYSAHGDGVNLPINTPEKFVKTRFRYDTVPNYETGFSERRCLGPSGTELIYALPFSKEAATKLYNMRDGDDIQFSVKMDGKKNFEVKKQNNTLELNFKLFTENTFEYLYAANYISNDDKLRLMKAAEMEGYIPPQSDDDRAASILAQQALSDKQKMASYQ